jgi:lysophospholipase L1-like esterase
LTRWATWLGIGASAAVLVGGAARGASRFAERHLLASYCATSAAGSLAARAAPWLAAALGLALAALVPAAVRWLRPHLHRPRASSVGGVALAVAASLTVSELYLRHLHGRLTGGAGVAAAEGRAAPMTHADAELGWSYVPGRTTWVEVAGRRLAYAIDGEGNRAATPEPPPAPGASTILFAGESIAFGYGLAYEETFPFLVGRDLGVESVNLAVVGYGSDQAYQRVVEALARTPRPLAVVTLFIPDQIRRNVDPWRARLALAPDGALERVPPRAGPLLLRLLHELPWHGDEALRVTKALMRATADVARARGAFPLFVVTNYGAACRGDDGGEPWIVGELFARQDLPYVRVDLGPEDRLPGWFERHPSPGGARKIAAAAEAALAHRPPRITTPSAPRRSGR